MATFRKRFNRWQVQIRRIRQPTISRSFLSEADAQRWARHMEAELDANLLPHDFRQLETTRLADILIRYRKEIIPTKRGGRIETIIVDAFLRDPIAELRLGHLKLQDFADYRDNRLTRVCGSRNSTAKSLRSARRRSPSVVTSIWFHQERASVPSVIPISSSRRWKDVPFSSTRRSSTAMPCRWRTTSTPRSLRTAQPARFSSARCAGSSPIAPIFAEPADSAISSSLRASSRRELRWRP